MGRRSARRSSGFSSFRNNLPPGLGSETGDPSKVLQVPGYYRQPVFESCCADPHIFDSDRFALRFERCQQVSGPDRFGLADRKNVDKGQNLACDAFPQARTMGDASCSVAKLSDADRRSYDILRRNLIQPAKKRRIRILSDDFGKDVRIEKVLQRLVFVRGLRSVRGRWLPRALTTCSTAARKGSSSASQPRTAPRPFSGGNSSGGTSLAIGRPRRVIRIVSPPKATRPKRFESCSLASATLIDSSFLLITKPFWSRWSTRSRCTRQSAARNREDEANYFVASASRRAVASRSSFAEMGGLYAGMPVTASPMIRLWMSWVPS